jgi:hypothetical protein
MKYRAVLFLFSAFLTLSFLVISPVRTVFADETVVNAGILPTIWYSTTAVYDGDTVTVYGGIQNHSDSDITGRAAFYIDGVSVVSIPFASKSQSIMEVSYPWHATLGKHTIKIVLSVPVNLLSTESNATALTVSVAPAGTSVTDLQKEIPVLFKREVKNIDTFTNSMASSVQSLKVKPLTQDVDQKNLIKKGTTHDAAAVIGAVTQSSVFTKIYNTALDWIAFIIRHWLWTIIIILAIILIIRFF